MTVRSDTAHDPPVTVESPEPSSQASYQEGVVAGLLGAAAVALWFLVVDTLHGHPLYTPSVLGTALFRRGAGLGALDTPGVSLEMVGMFTWVHMLIFMVAGGIAAHLLRLVERNPSFGFGVLLLFVFFQFGFTAAAALFAPPVIQALGWPQVLVANLLAAGAMGAYLWRRHRGITVRP